METTDLEIEQSLSSKPTLLSPAWIEKIEWELGRKVEAEELWLFSSLLSEKIRLDLFNRGLLPGQPFIGLENGLNTLASKPPRINLNSFKDNKRAIAQAAETLFSSPSFIEKWEKDSVKPIFQNEQSGKNYLFGLALNTNCFVTDTYRGTAIALAETVREMVSRGATPMYASFNFEALPFDKKGSPLVMRSINGFEDACHKFQIHSLRGELNFIHRNGDFEGALPVPKVGVVGKFENPEKEVTWPFKNNGDLIYMLGNSYNDLEGSEFSRVVLGIESSRCPNFDLNEEHEIHVHVRNLIQKNVIASATSVERGGLFAALMKCSFESGMGFQIETVEIFRHDCFLFGESQSRVVISLPLNHEDELQNYLVTNNVSFTKLGEVIENDAVINDKNFGSVNDWKTIVEKAKSI